MLAINDAYQQQLLNINGYFTFPFLSDIETEELKLIYHNHFTDTKTTFYSTSFHEDIALKKTVSDKIINLLQDKLNALVIDYKVLGSSFLKKNPNENNLLQLHQDWTVTDEEKYGSFTIWIPLQDTQKHNGAIRVIKGSHNIENNLRAPSLPVSFEAERNKFENHLQTLPLKKGEAFVFNQKLMHASWPNQSNEERLALTIGLVPKDADLFMLYFDKNKNEISQYSMPDDLFLHYPEIIQEPKIGKLIKTFSYTPEKFSENELREKLYRNRTKYTTMQPLFANSDHQKFFEENGYLKIQALDEKDIIELKNFLFESGIKKVTDYGFYVGMDHENKELVARMMEKVEAVAMPKIAPFLKDYQLITASYVIKDPNPKGVVPPHQDWTFVEDEAQHCSVTCWIPLVDTNMENGCLGLIKGSHKFFNSVRPSPSPQVPSPLAKHMFGIFPYMQLMEMKAGEALIFDNRTFHSSPPNITNEPRLAIGMSFTQKNAKLRHYYLKPGTKDRLLKYAINPVFFTKYDNGLLSRMYENKEIISDYECIDELPFVWDDLSKEEIKRRIETAGNTYNTLLAAHMAKLFGAQMKNGIADKIKNVLSLPKRIYNKVLG